MLRPTFLLVTLSTGVAAIFLATPHSDAQTVRFLTSVGAFDMQLNPTNDPDLQPHVDNLLAYVGAGRYHAGVINRAADSFVLQLGGFLVGDSTVDTIPLGGFDPVDKFNEVIVDANNDGQVDFDTTGLTNNLGTVSLALAAGDPNSGTSSFFVNLGDNGGLDPQGFVPFATIENMATINRIMGLEKVDISAQVGQDGSLAYIDVPLTPDGEFVILESVMVVSQSSVAFEGPIRWAAGLPPAPTSGASSQTLTGSGATSSALTSSSLASSTSVAPEPAAAALLLASALALGGRRSRCK